MVPSVRRFKRGKNVLSRHDRAGEAHGRRAEREVRAYENARREKRFADRLDEQFESVVELERDRVDGPGRDARATTGFDAADERRGRDGSMANGWQPGHGTPSFARQRWQDCPDRFHEILDRSACH